MIYLISPFRFHIHSYRFIKCGKYFSFDFHQDGLRREKSLNDGVNVYNQKMIIIIIRLIKLDNFSIMVLNCNPPPKKEEKRNVRMTSNRSKT